MIWVPLSEVGAPLVWRHAMILAYVVVWFHLNGSLLFVSTFEKVRLPWAFGTFSKNNLYVIGGDGNGASLERIPSTLFCYGYWHLKVNYRSLCSTHPCTLPFDSIQHHCQLMVLYDYLGPITFESKRML